MVVTPRVGLDRGAHGTALRGRPGPRTKTTVEKTVHEVRISEHSYGVVVILTSVLRDRGRDSRHLSHLGA